VKLFRHPALRGLDLDSPEAGMARARIIRSKPGLADIYRRWYVDVAEALPKTVSGPVFELGSGGGFLQEFIPGLITSEVLRIPGVDLVADGQCLPFRDQALRAIVMLDVMHHLPRVEHFFNEAQRCVKPGGVIVMVEPWVTGWSKIVYRYLHQEPFIPESDQWHFPPGGPLSQANAALPWIVFQRDRHIFEKRFPRWRLTGIKLNGAISYLLSGGVTYRSFLPQPAVRLTADIEKVLVERLPAMGLFARIVLTLQE